MEKGLGVARKVFFFLGGGGGLMSSPSLSQNTFLIEVTPYACPITKPVSVRLSMSSLFFT